MLTAEGLHRVRFDDDIRRLQRPDASVAQENAFVQRGMKGLGDSRFILIRGTTREELLQRQELLQDRLQMLMAEGALASIQALAPFLPSAQRQQENRALLAKGTLTNPEPLRRTLKGVGLSADIANSFLRDLGQPLTLFSVDEWLKSPASQLLRALWVNSTHGFASAALVTGNADSRLLAARLKDLPGVRVFDQIDEYTQLFHRYRRLSMGLILIAYLGVWALMMARYGVKGGTLVTAPSVGAISIYLCPLRLVPRAGAFDSLPGGAPGALDGHRLHHLFRRSRARRHPVCANVSRGDALRFNRAALVRPARALPNAGSPSDRHHRLLRPGPGLSAFADSLFDE